MKDGELQSASSGGVSFKESATTDDYIKSRIFTIRGVQVMLDRDLTALYGVETRVLNQAVKRNGERFPVRFMFQLDKEKWNDLKSQIVTSSWGGDRSLPYVFTEQGVAMLSSVLRSPTAVEVSIQIMDVFVAMRKALASVAPLLARLDTVEHRQIADQSRNEERFDTIFKAMDGGLEQCCQCESVASSQFQLPMRKAS